MNSQHDPKSSHTSGLRLLLLSTLVLLILSATWPRSHAASWSQSLEKDWLLEAQLHHEAKRSADLTPPDDAAGGCDGVTNGGFGFHTALEKNPWWQVDLSQSKTISQIRLWNRADSDDNAQRAAHFKVLVSTNAADWQEVYQHNGKVFYGYRMPDRQPLVVRLPNIQARFVRIQLPGQTFLHLDEVEVISSSGSNLSLRKPATQSSLSEWSVAHARNLRSIDWSIETRSVLAHCSLWLTSPPKAPSHKSKPTASTEALRKQVENLRRQLDSLPKQASAQPLYLKARALQRSIALGDPLLDFDSILFTKRVPGSYSHMSDQYYGWWSRPGGGIYLLRNFKSSSPTTECLTDKTFRDPGSFLRPSLSFDASKVLFAWCRFYPDLAAQKDKLNKANVPEDAFYHVFEMNIDGSGVRQLTHGKYDNFDARYLPDGRIVFLSTRRGQAIQVGKQSAAASLAQKDLPDCYVRCGGDASRPVAVYTLHTMDANGGDLTPISPFEMFEWEPSVANDGTIIYSRWDYVDRDNMPYMSLWSINPDGTNARLVYGNYTKSPHCTFEPKAIPGSSKLIFTASGHHSQTMGTLVLLDPAIGTEGEAPIKRLTPDISFPEIESWPTAFYATPWPLSERTYLVAWGVEEEIREGRQRPKNGMGIYLFNHEVGRELLFRDPDISSMYPIPVRSQPTPPALASSVKWDGPQEGRFIIADVTRGLKTIRPGQAKALRIIAVPAKTQPWMNQPVLGLTHDDPGKAVLGTVPVEPDGSAFFRAPSGVALFFQVLDQQGRAVQTMRSATHVQPGQTLSCVGCHDPRKETPPPSTPLIASLREPSKITLGPEGSWTMRFDKLIQPVLDTHCVSCHNPKSDNLKAASFDLSPARAYQSLTRSGQPSLSDLVLTAYREGVSTEGHTASLRSSVLQLLSQPNGHHGVVLTRYQLDRFTTWMDAYAQQAGAFSPDQERELERLRQVWADLLIDPVAKQTASKDLP